MNIVPVPIKVIISAAWVWYVLKSKRVKETFVFLYPESAWRYALLKNLNDTFAGKPAIQDELMAESKKQSH